MASTSLLIALAHGGAVFLILAFLSRIVPKHLRSAMFGVAVVMACLVGASNIAKTQLLADAAAIPERQEGVEDGRRS